MTRGTAKTRRCFVEWPLKYDAHSWLRSDDRRTLRPTGRGESGNNRVQEIVSGTKASTFSSSPQSRANKPGECFLSPTLFTTYGSA